MRKYLFLLFSLAICCSYAQSPQKLNSAEIHQAIKKLNFLGSVLYVAAHPDDENTRLISYFSNAEHARTAYLSITRGDGGQNLIGPELKEQLGIIRTQELLAARRIDGGEQIFTRAIDFGYTKTPEEAMEFWNSNEVLGDVVWAIRKFKPDVIINRFNHRTSGETHGQHTASALLTIDAFDLAGVTSSFKDQLEYTTAHQPKKLFFNTSPWFYESEEAFEEALDSTFLEFETGVYFPLLGLSNPEIAALSRSQHQSQGFGSTGSRGSQKEYLEMIKGDLPAGKTSVFEGIDTSWSRVKGGAEIGKILATVEKEYDFQDPAASLPGLVRAYSLIQKLEDEHWKQLKSEEIKEIIAASAGLYLEATAQNPSAVPSEEIKVNFEAINRSAGKMKLMKVTLQPGHHGIEVDNVLSNNESWKDSYIFPITATQEYTTPYWLKEEGSAGKYKVENKEWIGLPETPASVKAKFHVEIQGEIIPFEKNIVYKYNDAVEGEVYQPFEIIPPVSVKIRNGVMIFSDTTSKTVPVTVYAGKNEVKGELSLKAGPGWKIEPASAKFSIPQKGDVVTINFRLTPPAGQSETHLEPQINTNGKIYEKELVILDYRHIPRQAIVKPAAAKVVKLDIEKKGERIAFIEGAGDVVPESLQQIGYQVQRIHPDAITAAALKDFDAVILGIRAYNVVEQLKYRQKELHEYVKNGGNLIVQYNTSRGLIINPIAPFDLQLSRDRVTEEDAEVRFLAPEHPVLITPNKITAADFENWVQERGLYFADEWGPDFTPVLAMNDKNEPSREGSLMVAKYGKGHYIYTGLSFFRQFPEGVPGAYRLFANMVSLGK